MNSIQVGRVRELLRGRWLILFGGEIRQNAIDNLKKAFGLEDVIWIETKAKTTYRSIETHIQSKDVAVVLQLVCFSRYQYKEGRRWCQEAGVPFVMLPGGYGVNQVAAQIESQAGRRLEVERRRRQAL